MKRKVVAWHEYQPPVEWTYKLECGHENGRYPDDVFDDESKERVEANGNEVECYECSRLQDEADKLEAKAAEIRDRLASKP